MESGTISHRINRLPLKARLAWGYIIVFTLLFAIGFGTVYLISENYRKEEFYQRLKDKTYSTYRILVKVDQIDKETLKLFDHNTVNSLYDEKILLFDAGGRLIYNSLDDDTVTCPKEILIRLFDGEQEIRTNEGAQELLALRFTDGHQVFYGIAEAYDRFGKSKITFLRNSLIVVFAIVTVLLMLASLALATAITRPISALAREIDAISPDDLSVRVHALQGNDEISMLSSKFNELLERVERAFKFQHHFIHHVSHELKTPLSVMLANAEGALAGNDAASIKESLAFQKNNLMELSHIINAMLDISKTENQLLDIATDTLRVDELLFECVDETSFLTPGVQVDVFFDQVIDNSDSLTIHGSSRMLKLAFMNLLKNAIIYDLYHQPEIHIQPQQDHVLIKFVNTGELISPADREKLFTHLFRGENSRGKKGFGLGLPLVLRIIKLHNGDVSYSVDDNGRNCFTIQLPLNAV